MLGSIVVYALVQSTAQTFGEAVLVCEEASRDNDFSDKNRNQKSRVLNDRIRFHYESEREMFMMMIGSERDFTIFSHRRHRVGNEQRKKKGREEEVCMCVVGGGREKAKNESSIKNLYNLI